MFVCLFVRSIYFVRIFLTFLLRFPHYIPLQCFLILTNSRYIEFHIPEFLRTDVLAKNPHIRGAYILENIVLIQLLFKTSEIILFGRKMNF